MVTISGTGGGPSSPTSTSPPSQTQQQQHRTRHQSGSISTSTNTTKCSEFLDLNVRELFENTTIEKTVEVQKRLGVEIERKKEEMRVLVGERYRDLIDAADTIGTMKANSSEIFSKLSHLRTKLSAFPMLLSSKSGLNANAESISNNSLQPEMLEVAFKLKLSQEIPRQIQLQLQKQNLVCALHCYLLYTKKIQDVLINYKWSFLEQNDNDNNQQINEVSLKESILNACNNLMHEFNTSSEKLTECIIVKSILNSSTCEATLEEFLGIRVLQCKQLLQSNENQDYSAEDLLVQYFSRTLLSLYQTFIEPELYNSTLKTIRQPNISALSLGFVGSASSKCCQSLQQFNNERINIEDPIRIGKLTELIMNNFIPQLKTLLDQSYQNKQYLNRFESLKELVAYKIKSCELLHLECENLGKILYGSNQLKKSLWNELFQYIFDLKCQEVINKKVKAIFQELAILKYKQADANFGFLDFIWKQQQNSILFAESQSPSEDKNELELLLKLKCLTPNVALLCEEFEISIKSLLGDFNSIRDYNNSNNINAAKDISSGTLLKEYMSATILKSFQQFLNKEKEYEEREDDNSIDKNSLFWARLLVGFIDLCPTLWKMLEKQDIVTLRQTFWTRIETCWTQWSTKETTSFQKELNEKIPKLLDQNIIIELMPVGEIYKPPVEEAAGSNNNDQQQQQLQPSIHVPIQLSHILHALLFKFCKELASIGPQSIPKSVRDILRENLGQIIIEFYYKQLITTNEEEEEDSSGRNHLTAQLSVQFIFDLKLVQWFHPKLGSGNEQVESILQKLQSMIDPFDWDIIGSRLNTNLKRFLFENHLTLGLLFSEESHTFIAQNFKTKQNQTYPTSTRGLLAPLPLLPI